MVTGFIVDCNNIVTIVGLLWLCNDYMIILLATVLVNESKNKIQ